MKSHAYPASRGNITFSTQERHSQSVCLSVDIQFCHSSPLDFPSFFRMCFFFFGKLYCWRKYYKFLIQKNMSHTRFEPVRNIFFCFKNLYFWQNSLPKKQKTFSKKEEYCFNVKQEQKHNFLIFTLSSDNKRTIEAHFLPNIENIKILWAWTYFYWSLKNNCDLKSLCNFKIICPTVLIH